MQINPFQNRTLGIFGGGQYATPQMQPSIFGKQKHPCNGMGGANCECGGDCLQSEVIQPSYEQIPIDENYAEVVFSRHDSSWIKDVSKASRDNSNNVIVIANSNRDENRMEFVFAKDIINGGWTFDNIFQNKTYRFPEDSSIHDFALAGGIVYQIYLLNKFKLQKSKSQYQNVERRRNGDYYTGSVFQRPQEYKITPTCVDHNMTCDGIADHFSLPSGFCFVEINILECCEKHDIALWCGVKSRNALEQASRFTEINSDVAMCVTGKIFDALTNDTPWYCGGFITGAIFSIVYGIFSTILGYFLTIIISPKNDEEFPKDGRNDASCLCGGTDPTIQCFGDGPHSECVDLCKRLGKKSDCYNCTLKKCNYGGGRLLSAEYDYGPTNDPDRCCPGTRPNCLSTKCKACNKCQWGCDENGRWVITHKNPEFGLPCCSEQRPRDVHGRLLPCKL